MHYYQRNDDVYVLVTGPYASDEFEAGETESEVITMMDKVQYATKAREAATDMAQAAEALMRLEEIWNDRMYGVGLVNEIKDTDLLPVGINQNQLVMLINFAGQLKNFLNNTPIFAGD